jgi:hypothetical protein
MEYMLRSVPTLGNHKLAMHRVVYAASGVAMAEITECFDRNGLHTELPMVMLFDIDSEERIRRIAVYCQQAFITRL